VSYYRPQPKRDQKRLPPKLPRKVVSSHIRDKEIIGNWLIYYLKGGDHLHDFSPENNHGTIHGGKWVQGRIGWGLEFDGEDDYVDVGTITHETNSFTVSLWMYIRSSEEWNTLVENGHPEYSWDHAYDIRVGTEGEYHVLIGNGSTLDEVSFTTGWAYNTWYHITLVYDGSTWKFYQNGNKEKESTPDLDITGGDGSTCLASHDMGAAWFLDGKMDEVHIYDRALSSSEI